MKTQLTHHLLPALLCVAFASEVRAQLPNAWQIGDNSTAASFSYRTDLPPPTQQAATNDGWSFTVTSKFVGDAGSGSQTMLMIYGDGVRRWEVLWSLSSGDLQAYVYSSGGMHLVTTGGTGTDAYHTHQIIFDPTNQTASYLVDGQMVVSNWTGNTAAWPAGRVAWGSGSAGGIGTMNFRSVSFATTNGVVATYDAGTEGNPAMAPDPTNSPFAWTPSSYPLPANITVTNVSPDTQVQLPVAGTLAADHFTTNSARLNGLANASGSPTTAWFEWGNDTNYGNVTAGQDIGNGTTNVTLSTTLGELIIGPDYHFRLVASNALGVANGIDQSFNLATFLPVVATGPAEQHTPTNALVNAVVNPDGYPTLAWFEWGTNTSYGNLTASQNAGSGTLESNLSAALSGLVPGVQYHYRVVASNEFGVVQGSDMTLGPYFIPKHFDNPLNPMDFVSLGMLDLSNGTFVIDTDALTIFETNAVSTNVLFTGVMDDQGEQADSFGPGSDVTTIGSNGIPYIAVFTFDSISLASNAVISVTGHRALALLSQGKAEIDTIIALNAQARTNTPGPGGFPGGNEMLYGGQGPGAGGWSSGVYTTSGVWGGGGGFGSSGGPGGPNNIYISVLGTAGTAYGTPSLATLQGGSGGGSAITDTNKAGAPLVVAAGGGGGGSLEIGAIGKLNLGTNASLQANGEDGGTNYWPFTANEYLYRGGAGSGGGILLFGQPVTVEGTVDVTCKNHQSNQAGDGRIAVLGYQIPGITYYIPGVTDPSQIDTSHFIVGKGTLAVSGYGSFANSGWHTLVTSGNPLELDSLTQITQDTNAGVNLFIENNANDITVWGGGEVTVPTNGVLFDGILELSGPTSQITGSGTLTNRGLITGSGQIQTVLINDTGGRVSGIENTLVFTEAVTNEPGGKIGAIDSTLDFNNGLDNLGTLDLINTTVAGTIVNNGFTSLAGTNTFTGGVSGAGNFNGMGTAQFNGTYSPGNSPAAVSFGGDVAFSPAATLHIELGGTNAGSQYDQLNVSNNITFGGGLNVVLINGFVPAVGEMFHLINAGTRLGSFATVTLPALPGGLEWQNNLNTDGTITVVTTTGAGPQFSSVILSGSGLIFSGTGGVTNGSYVLLSSTNLAMPLINWLPVSTNPFDANGNFLFTNPINLARPQEFYRLLKQ